MRFALDSNVIIYVEGTDDSRRNALAQTLIEQIGRTNIVLPLQAAGETLKWLVTKGKLSMPAAAARLSTWLRSCQLQPTDAAVFSDGLELVTLHRFQVWDAIILAAAAQSKSDILLSEDMHSGFVWRGTTIVNPFVDPAPPELVIILAQK